MYVVPFMGSTTHPDSLNVDVHLLSLVPQISILGSVPAIRETPPLLCTNIRAFGVRVVSGSTKVDVCPVTSTEVLRICSNFKTTLNGKASKQLH